MVSGFDSLRSAAYTLAQSQPQGVQGRNCSMPTTAALSACLCANYPFSSRSHRLCSSLDFYGDCTPWFLHVLFGFTFGGHYVCFAGTGPRGEHLLVPWGHSEKRFDTNAHRLDQSSVIINGNQQDVGVVNSYIWNLREFGVRASSAAVVVVWVGVELCVKSTRR